MAHHQAVFNPEAENFKFGGRMKTLTLVLMVLGIVGVALSFLSGENHHSRFWSNLLLNAYYFNGIALVGMFLISAHTIGYGGWLIIIKRIMESFGVFIWFTFGCFGLILLGMQMDWHGLYHHWTHPAPGDTIVGDKLAYLNKGFFAVRVLIFFALWLIVGHIVRKHSLAEDAATDNIKHYQKAKYIAAAFISVFGVSSSIFSWDAVMSLDPHWYSTLFGWYNFASYACGSYAMMILIITYLKYKGHLQMVTENHLHDIGKFLFGFSIFYTYLWFSQFMLIWYGNVPEDTAYFIKRFDVPLFKVLFFVTLFINFVFPLLFLVKREAKRSFLLTSVASVILIGGHYLDFYLMVMPEPNAIHEHHEAKHEEGHHAAAKNTTHLLAENTHTATTTEAAAASPAAEEVKTTDAVKTEEHAVEATSHEAAKEGEEHATEKHEEAGAAHHGSHEAPKTLATLGIVELFFFLGFLGAFLFIVLNRLSKNRLVPVNHPMLSESLRHHI